MNSRLEAVSEIGPSYAKFCRFGLRAGPKGRGHLPLRQQPLSPPASSGARPLFHQNMSDRKTTGPGESEALQLTRAMKQGLQFRTLRLMTKADANLAMEALEAPIKDGRKVGLNEAQTFAWKLYCRYYLKVRKWWENRFIEADTRVYRGAATYSIPDWLVVADLNWNERHLLADVAWLQAHGERGCDKSIVGFAMELGMSIQAVESMVGRLKREGWLKTERVGDRRILIIVNKSILQVGKSPPSVLEQVSKNSPTR